MPIFIFGDVLLGTVPEGSLAGWPGGGDETILDIGPVFEHYRAP